MSSGAHAYAAGGPVNFGIGLLEEQALWGRLDPSRHAPEPQFHAWVTGAAQAWSPRSGARPRPGQETVAAAGPMKCQTE